MLLSEIIEKFENSTSFFTSSIIGNTDIDINGLNLCNRQSVNKRVISYAVSGKYVDTVKEAIHVKALIINTRDTEFFKDILVRREGAIICTDNPESYFYALHEFLYFNTEFYEKFEYVSEIGDGCEIAESAVIEKGVSIGNNVIIGANTVVRHGTVIEDNVTIGCNTTIGSEGFQVVVNEKGVPIHVIHAGGCHISSNVHIGDNTCICNSLFEGATYIGENVKIDNLVYIAHNNYVDKNVVITSHVVLCGSCRIEESVWIAPNTSLINRVTIGAHSIVGMGSVVTKDVVPYSIVFGNPAIEHNKRTDFSE